jgi:hypothetical protein
MSRNLSNAKYLITRKDPQTGLREETVFTGSLKEKPKGWKVIEKIDSGSVCYG